MALIFLFYPFFFLSLYYMLTFNIFMLKFSQELLKLGIHMDNALLYCGIKNRTPCSYSSLYLSIFYPVFFGFHLDC